MIEGANMFKAIHSEQAPSAIGPYSQAVQIGNLLFLSGQIGFDPTTMELVSESCEAQAQQVFKNMQAVLKAANVSLSNVVKLTIFLKDLQDFPAINEIMKNHFQAPYPARSTIQVAGLPKNASIEIEAIAVI